MSRRVPAPSGAQADARLKEAGRLIAEYLEARGLDGVEWELSWRSAPAGGGVIEESRAMIMVEKLP